MSELPAFGVKKIRREDLPKGGQPLRTLHRQVLSLHRRAVRDADRIRPTWSTSAGSCCTRTATFFKEDEDWYLLVHAVCDQAAATTTAAAFTTTRPADLPRLHDQELRVRRRLDLRLLPGDPRAGVGVHRGGLPEKGQEHPQPEAEPTGGVGVGGLLFFGRSMARRAMISLAGGVSRRVRRHGSIVGPAGRQTASRPTPIVPARRAYDESQMLDRRLTPPAKVVLALRAELAWGRKGFGPSGLHPTTVDRHLPCH